MTIFQKMKDVNISLINAINLNLHDIDLKPQKYNILIRSIWNILYKPKWTQWLLIERSFGWAA